MRVSSKMISQRVLFNLSQSTSRFLKLQTTASSAKRINKPSDDPLGITSDLNFRSRLADIAQFNLNITYSKSWLTFSESALGNINNLIIEAKELAVQLGNDTFDANARLTAVSQVDEILNRILDAANSQYQGKYIFSGSKTGLPPILTSSAGAIYQGDYQDMLIEVERNSYININAFGNEFLTDQVFIQGEGFDLNPGVQANMWLDDLNSGNGVNMGAGQFILNTLNGTYTIDLLAANVENVQQVLDAINSQVPPVPNLTAMIAPNGSGLQLEDTTAHHLVAVDAVNSTPLSMLNGGTGVSQAPGTFVIKDSGGWNTTIDISADTNVFEVMNTINTALDAQYGVGVVQVTIDPEVNSFVVTNNSGVDIFIEEAGNGSTASDLGLVGSALSGEILNGRDLEPSHIQVLESAVGETLAADLGLKKSTEHGNLIGDDLDPRLTYYSKISSLNSNAGINLGVIRISSGLDSVDIDLSPLQNDPDATILDIVDLINYAGVDAWAALNSDSTGIIVKSEHNDRTFMITEADDGRTAKALGIFGSGDLLGNIMIFKNALQRNDVDEIGNTLEVFNHALDKLLTERSSTGSRIIRTESAETRMMTQELLVTNQLSQVEDADMLRVISELTTAEVVYQSALASAARMIQPSLIDFLI